MNRSRRHRVRTSLQKAVALCLMVSLWPAPVPWVHSHDVHASEPRLASHLTEYHAHDGADSHEGWHLHFAYLWRLADDPQSPEEPQEPPPCQRPVTPATASPAILTAAPPTAAFLSDVVFDPLPSGSSWAWDVSGHRICPGTFLNSFADVIAPHQLLGVLLC
jgi:hypothetical protein